MASLAFLECTRCGEQLSPEQPNTVCPKDGGVLYARYDLQSIKKTLRRESLCGRPANMWRYAEVLPGADPVTLGEGFTPMLPSRDTPNLFIKDEGLNPTGSFKARGLSAAVTMARHYCLQKLAIPSAGNAASALAAYAAAANIEAHIFMPRDVPMANRIECQTYGAHVTLVNGLISDCARMLQSRADTARWFDVSTLKEPFRLEGKKTMGYEIAEQMGWQLPDAIIYPTGGGVGLIGIWKAFEEMEELGWIGSERPQMVAVQSTGCAPIAKAWDEGRPSSDMWPNAATLASGLRVPRAYGDYLILDILKKSGGVALAVSDEEIMDALRHWARVEGIFAAPEGAAALAAYRRLRSSGFFGADDRVVLLNTGNGLKYLEIIEKQHPEAAPSPAAPRSRHIGGIIGPY